MDCVVYGHNFNSFCLAGYLMFIIIFDHLAIGESRNMAVPAFGTNRWNHCLDFFAGALRNLDVVALEGSKWITPRSREVIKQPRLGIKKLFFSAHVNGGPGWPPY